MNEHILARITYLRDYADRLVHFSESLNRWERRGSKPGNRSCEVGDQERAHFFALHAVRKRVEALQLSTRVA